MSRTANPLDRRIDALTSIRIFAAGAVFLLHVHAPEFVPAPLRVFMSNGYFGVSLFFMLSGFVLAWTYVDRMGSLSGRSLWNFFVARFARVYPLYLFALLVVMVPAIFTTGYSVEMLKHLFALQAWSGNLSTAFGYNAPGWSLSVEIFLYACFPFILIPLLKARRMVLLAVIAVSVMATFAIALWMMSTGQAALPATDPASAHRWLYRTPALRLFDFVIGMAAALLIRGSVTGPPRWASVTAQLGGLAGILGLMFSPSTNGTALSWDAAYQIPALLLIWGLATAPLSGIGGFLAARPLVVAGEASYAFYLLHLPLITIIATTSASRTLEWGVLTTILFALILLTAIGAHIVIEKPAQRWLRSRLSIDEKRIPASARDDAVSVS
jgi:peptidoglycan/LPS O-acetylase OafA/YrhL